MALETVVYQRDMFSNGYKDCYSSLASGGGGGEGGGEGGYLGYNDDLVLQEDDHKAFPGVLENNSVEQQSGFNAKWDYSSSSLPSVMQHAKQWDHHSSPETTCTTVDHQSVTAARVFHPILEPPLPAATSGRRKRRRTRSTKNKEEIENQRMTHIAVERNRRKQMNEYLAVLRSLMPPSYVQRGDQASIIGGAINFVKELEQLLQTMEAHKNTKQQQQQVSDHHVSGFSSSPFAEFFTFPQYSTRAAAAATGDESTVADQNQQWAVADIEMTMVESHANLKILSEKRPRQLLKMVAGLQGLRLTVLHLNVTTVHHLVLYSVSVKVEEGCHLNTVDDIAAAVNQMLHKIQEEEAAFS